MKLSTWTGNWKLSALLNTLELRLLLFDSRPVVRLATVTTMDTVRNFVDAVSNGEAGVWADANSKDLETIFSPAHVPDFDADPETCAAALIGELMDLLDRADAELYDRRAPQGADVESAVNWQTKLRAAQSLLG